MGVTLGELEKLIFFNKTKRNLSFRVTWCFFNVPVQELQTSRVATPQKELIYTLIHGRDPIPCRTTYIEYKSQGEDSLFLIGTRPNSIGFHCKVVFFSLFYDTGRGGNLRWAWKTHFFEYNIKRHWSFRGTGFWLKRSSLGTCLLPKGKYVYDIYPYTWKRPNSLHIEYRSPVKIFINILRNTTQFHWFWWQNNFFI